MEKELETIFAQQKLRITRPRREIFRVLQQSKAPLSAPMINTHCTTANRTSVYRTLELFHRLGIIKSVQFGWRQRYELADPFKIHHHHLSCTKCGQLIDLQSPDIENLVNVIASQNNFVVTDHTFEIRGLCQDCH